MHVCPRRPPPAAVAAHLEARVVVVRVAAAMVVVRAVAATVEVERASETGGDGTCRSNC